MGVIGASGSGKSTLAKALVGVWKPARGSIALDDTGPEQWTEEELGAAIGYLPQDVQLFEGTIAENIARFDPNATEEKIERAAEAAGLDTYIRMEFPKTGYNQPIFAGGANLAGGFRQRLGLARALYGDPFLVVLDEPNSNLDTDGEKALAKAISSVKARKGIVIVVSHRMSLLAEVETLMTMHKGQPEFLGPREAVYKRWLEKHQPGQLPPERPVERPQERPAAMKLIDHRPAHTPQHPAPQPAPSTSQRADAANVSHGTASTSNGHSPPPPSQPHASATSWSTAPLRLSKPIDRRGR
jgi:ABC-type protease/lipase transport system fused ATPase/permease subunit